VSAQSDRKDRKSLVDIRIGRTKRLSTAEVRSPQDHDGRFGHWSHPTKVMGTSFGPGNSFSDAESPVLQLMASIANLGSQQEHLLGGARDGKPSS
jgi:hypothetical protein